ncbi:MAG: SDR family oxidoreductase [Cytophagales bacterium]
MSTTKKIIITGGTKGIGKALVEEYSSHGYEVFTCGRSLETLKLLQSIADKHHNSIHAFQADLSKKEDCLAFCEWLLDQTNEIDILIHNSGVFIPGNILSEEDDLFEKTLNLNLRGPYLLNKKLYPLVKNCKGHIILMASVASEKPFPNCGTYVASKYALLGYGRVLREISKEDGVKVTTVMPGATLTASWDGTGVGLDRIMSPEAIATSIWNLTQLSGNALVEEITLRPLLGDL